MPDEPARVPSVDQLVEVHQALWWFTGLERESYKWTIEQEKLVLPRFERLADALAPIRERIDSIEGWPTKIKRALRGSIAAFLKTARQWDWKWFAMPKPERSAYLNERRASLDGALDEPMLEAALSLSNRWLKAERCSYDDLADEARARGLVPQSMTVVEARGQFDAAKARYKSEPRFGKCYPKVGEKEGDTFNQAFHVLHAELITLVPNRVERPPWQEQSQSTSPVGPQTAGQAKPSERQDKPAALGTGRQAKPPEAPPIDFDALGKSLLDAGQKLASKLVKFMKDRETATFQEVMDQVHGAERTDEAIRTLVNRTNNLLHDRTSRLRFSTADSSVVRHIEPE